MYSCGYMYSFRNLETKTHLFEIPRALLPCITQKRVNTVYEIMTQSLPKTSQAPITTLFSHLNFLKLSLRATELLGAERPEVLVQGVNSGAALLKGNDHADVAVRADNNDTTLLLVETHLGVGGGGGVGELAVPAVVGVDVVAVAGEERGQITRDLDVGAGGREDGAHAEEVRVGVVALVVADALEVGAGVRHVEGVLLGHVGGEVAEGLAGDAGLAGEDEEAERAVEGDLLLKVDHIGVDNTGDVGVDEQAAGHEAGALGVHDVRLGRVRGRPVERVGLVEHSVAAGELARLLEGVDELVLLLAGDGTGGGGSHLVGGRRALREELGVLVVERQQGLGDVLALGLVGLENVAVGEASLDGVDLPGQVEGVQEGSVHALTSLGLFGSQSRCKARKWVVSR